MRKNTTTRFLKLWCAFLAMGAFVAPQRPIYAQDTLCCATTPPIAFVEQTSESFLTPTVQVAESPTDHYEAIVVLNEEPAPEQWEVGGVEMVLPETPTTPASLVTINVSTTVVAVTFWDVTGQTTRFGYGIRSEVTVDLGNGEPTSHAGAFNLVAETADETEAMDGASQFVQTLAAGGVGSGGGGGGVGGGVSGDVSACISACMKDRFQAHWDEFVSCLGIVGTAAATVGSLCGVGCLSVTPFIGPAVIPCLIDCATATGALGIAGGAACLAYFTAAMAAALVGCSGECMLWYWG
ncbi:MAG: hypothetical protein U0638_06815 [Phycisphaerales bacterium]